VTVLNRAAAARFWPGEDPLGRRLFVGDSTGTGEWLTVVGVAADVERGRMAERHWSLLYRPLDQAPLYHPAASLFARIPDRAAAVLPALQSAVREALGHPTSAFRSVEQELGERFLEQRFNALALNLFAAFALLLASMGIYGSVAYRVARRTREIGIRMALGAEKGAVLRLVARDATGVAATGILLGLVGSVALVRVLRAFVSATNSTDPWASATAACVVGAAALLATWVPARRATAVDPVEALRSD
jgi:putative ABC transport system permease protein